MCSTSKKEQNKHDVCYSSCRHFLRRRLLSFTVATAEFHGGSPIWCVSYPNENIDETEARVCHSSTPTSASGHSHVRWYASWAWAWARARSSHDTHLCWKSSHWVCYVMLSSLPFWLAILVKVLLDPTSIKNVKITVYKEILYSYFVIKVWVNLMLGLLESLLTIDVCWVGLWHLRNEKGLFYGLDLGGTNFRVLRVQLGGKDDRVIDTEFDQVSIPQDLMSATSQVTNEFIHLLCKIILFSQNVVMFKWCFQSFLLITDQKLEIMLHIYLLEKSWW